MESLASAEQIYSRLRDIKSIATLPQVMTRIMAVVTDGNPPPRIWPRKSAPIRL